MGSRVSPSTWGKRDTGRSAAQWGASARDRADQDLDTAWRPLRPENAAWCGGRAEPVGSTRRSHREAMASRPVKTANSSKEVHMGRVPGESHIVQADDAVHRTMPAA